MQKKSLRILKRIRKKSWLEKTEIEARNKFLIDEANVYLNMPVWMPFEEYIKLNDLKLKFNSI